MKPPIVTMAPSEMSVTDHDFPETTSALASIMLM